MLRLLMIATLLTSSMGQADEARGFHDENKVIYKTIDGRDLAMYFCKPADWEPTDRRGAVVFFHGGGWRGGTPSQFRSQAAELANEGIVSFGPIYRFRSKDNGLTPLDCITDAKSAMRWVRAHADEYGIDPERIVASGGSAGGHLAAAVAIVPGLDDPNDDMSISTIPAALVLFNPAIDLKLVKMGEAVTNAGSPQRFVAPGNPPTIIFHGTEDKTVKFATVEKFTETMNEHGNTCELVPYEGAGHGFFNPGRDKTSYNDTVRRMIKFLREQGIIEE